jgi:hypothetical protein
LTTPRLAVSILLLIGRCCMMLVLGGVVSLAFVLVVGRLSTDVGLWAA